MRSSELDLSVLSALGESDQNFVRSIVEKVEKRPELMNDFCDLMSTYMNKEDAEKFHSLSSNIKHQACFEHLVVNLLAGKLNKQKIENIASKYES